VGFDFAAGRLDVSHHPFTGGIPDDVRLTTRYDENDFASSLMAALHETGHAMYERGLPVQWRLQPVGEAMGMAIHESQSLIVEMQACRSDPYLQYLSGELKAVFTVDGPAWSAGNLGRCLRRVERSLIRVEADEVTYPLHVILRYRLERALISGDLQVADLPGAWREGMDDLVGAVPPTDREGCMQDIHWMGGDFGYFPTYTLGAIAAAQMFATACSDRPDLLPGLSGGDFLPLMQWLTGKVHSHGAYYAAAGELLTAATGRSFDVATFKTHLRDRYLPAV
jgi:carboxypeptidase Taq